MSENYTLSVKKREKSGKGAARATRRAGLVPGVIYGAKKDPQLITVDPVLLWKAANRKGFFSSVYTLDVEGKSERVIPRDLQLHLIKDQAIHVDFMRLSKNSVVNVEVPVTFINEEDSPGLKRGGVLNVVRHTVELICKSDKIPEQLEFDLTDLGINASVHISSVSLPKGVELAITDRDFTVATIAAPSGLRSAESDADEEEEATEETTEE